LENSQLVSWLKERGIEGETADYATLANVQDKHVYGVMVPLAIAAHAASVTLVDIIGDSMQSFVVVDMTDGLHTAMTLTVRRHNMDFDDCNPPTHKASFSTPLSLKRSLNSFLSLMRTKQSFAPQ